MAEKPNRLIPFADQEKFKYQRVYKLNKPSKDSFSYSDTQLKQNSLKKVVQSQKSLRYSMNKSEVETLTNKVVSSLWQSGRNHGHMSLRTGGFKKDLV